MQLIATVPTAYLTGLALQFQQEAEAVFSAIPPLFWPVLAVLVLAVTVYPGFVLPFVTLVRAPKEKYRAQVETAYEWVVCAYKPWILTSEHPTILCGIGKRHKGPLILCHLYSFANTRTEKTFSFLFA